MIRSSLLYGEIMFVYAFAASSTVLFSQSSYMELHFFNTRAFKPGAMNTITTCLKTKENNTLLKFPLLDPRYDKSTITVYTFLESQKYSYIFFIEDAQDRQYVIKQQKSGSLGKQFRVVCEMLCAHMAELVEIPAHLVRMLSAGLAFPGKFLTDRTASLHTKVPGITVRDLIDHPYAKLDIKQNNDSFLSSDQMGLNKRVISNMALHPTLPLIVALDTFVSNRDRSKANVIYDEKNDAFYAIDMALIYDTSEGRKLLAQLSCDQVESMINKKEIFTALELEGLKRYQETLMQLISYFTPKRIIA